MYDFVPNRTKTYIVKMKMDELLQTLHRFIGTKKPNYEFIQWLPALFMRDTTSDEEEDDDVNGIYYPFGENKNDKNYKSKLIRYYNGTRKIPIKDASKILSCFEDKRFKEEFDNLEKDSREKFVNELKDFGVITEVDRLETAVSELFYSALKAASEGKSEFDIPNDLKFDDKFKEKVENEKSIKNQFGAELLEETRFICPYDGCYRNLIVKNDNKSDWNFRIVPINSKITEPLPQNYIALCPECAEKYLLNTDEEATKRLKSIKENLSKMSPLEDDWSGNEKLLNSVGKVIQKISLIPYDKVSELKFVPVSIDKKIQKNNPAFYINVKNYVTNYFNDVSQLFKDAETQNGLKFDRFCEIVRWHYKDLNEKNIYEQSQIFEKLTNWLSGATNEEYLYCSIVIAYFVQKCEVFDAIA